MLLINSDSDSMIYIVQTIDSWGVLHMSSIYYTWYILFILSIHDVCYICHQSMIHVIECWCLFNVIVISKLSSRFYWLINARHMLLVTRFIDAVDNGSASNILHLWPIASMGILHECSVYILAQNSRPERVLLGMSRSTLYGCKVDIQSSRPSTSCISTALYMWSVIGYY